MKKKISLTEMMNFIVLNVGVFLIALGISWFFQPNTIAPGGITGLAVVIEKVTGVPVYITNLLINGPLFIIGVLVLGKKTGLKTAYGTIALSGYLALLANLDGFAIHTSDLLLASIYGGLFVGAGIGILFRLGGSTGGTDLIGAILNKFFPNFSPAKLMMMVDLCVVILAGVVSQTVEIALYSLMALYIIVQTADFIVEDLSYSKSFLIISNNPEEISRVILSDLNRGVTGFDGKGMYSGKERTILMVVVNRSEVQKVKKIVHEIDPGAFVMVNTTHEVLGEGFRSIK